MTEFTHTHTVMSINCIVPPATLKTISYIITREIHWRFNSWFLFISAIHSDSHKVTFDHLGYQHATLL